MCQLDLPNIRVMVTGQGRKRFIWKAKGPSTATVQRERGAKFWGNNRKDREDTGAE